MPTWKPNPEKYHAGTPSSGTVAALCEWLLVELRKVERAITATQLTPTRTVTTDDNIYTADGWVIGDATAGNITLTLPPLPEYAGRTFIVGKGDASVNTVTVDGDGALIVGAATAVIATQYESIVLTATQTEWWIS